MDEKEIFVTGWSNKNGEGASGLRRNILSGAILALGNILISIISYPLYLKYLGLERYGLWAILSVVVSFSAMARLGFDTAMIKYVAEEYGKESKLGIEKYFSTAIIILLIGGIIIFLVLFSLRGFIVGILGVPEKYIPVATTLLPCIVALSIFMFLVEVTDGVLRGLGRVDFANYYDLGGKAISIIATVIFFEFGYGIWSLFWGQILFYILLGSLAFFTIYRKLGNLFFSISSFDLKYLKKMIGFGGTMTAAKLVQFLVFPFNKVVIARYIGLSGVTYFEIANKTVMQLGNIFNMSIRAIMPEISKLSVLEYAKSKIDNVLKKAMGLIFYLAVPVFVILFFLGPFLLRLWLSSQYMLEIANAFRIILAGYAVNLLAIPIYYLFMGIGKVSYCLIGHLVQAILNVVVVFIFVALKITNLYSFSGIYSSSVALSAILLIILFVRYGKWKIGIRNPFSLLQRFAENRSRMMKQVEGPKQNLSGVDLWEDKPLVSIVTTSLNLGRFIQETILSVKKQDYPNIEHIVIDGGSTDNTLEILKKYENTYNLRWISEPDEGQADAANKGFEMAKGAIVGWLDSDDVYLTRDAISYVVKQFEAKPGSYILYGDAAVIDKNSIVQRIACSPPFNYQHLLRGDFIRQSATFMRREVIKQHRLSTDCKYVMDYEFWLRLGNVYNFSHVSRVFSADRKRPDRISVSQKSKLKEEDREVKKLYGQTFGAKYYLKKKIWDKMVGAVMRLKGLYELFRLCSSSSRSNFTIPVVAEFKPVIIWNQMWRYNEELLKRSGEL